MKGNCATLKQLDCKTHKAVTFRVWQTSLKSQMLNLLKFSMQKVGTNLLQIACNKLITR